jgi:lysophospholipase L1-like esterase
VVLIPTKERVYAKLLNGAGSVNNNSKLADARRQEDAVREVIVRFLREEGIEFVDTLPALEEGAIERDIYPLTDPHPNRAGYRVIAESINRYLSR